MKIKNFLLEAGIYPNLQGYKYVIRAVEITKIYNANNTSKMPLFKYLYTNLAKEFKTKLMCIGRSIRYVIEQIPKEQLIKFKIKPHPSVSEFIFFWAEVADDKN